MLLLRYRWSTAYGLDLFQGYCISHQVKQSSKPDTILSIHILYLLSSGWPPSCCSAHWWPQSPSSCYCWWSSTLLSGCLAPTLSSSIILSWPHIHLSFNHEIVALFVFIQLLFEALVLVLISVSSVLFQYFDIYCFSMKLPRVIFIFLFPIVLSDQFASLELALLILCDLWSLWSTRQRYYQLAFYSKGVKCLSSRLIWFPVVE